MSWVEQGGVGTLFLILFFFFWPNLPCFSSSPSPWDLEGPGTVASQCWRSDCSTALSPFLAQDLALSDLP